MSGEALKIAVKGRQVKRKGEKEWYKLLNAVFHRLAGRDKKAYCVKFKNKIKLKKKERKKGSLPQWSMQRNRGKQKNGKD